jgi:S1-C subfamily serine protease
LPIATALAVAQSTGTPPTSPGGGAAASARAEQGTRGGAKGLPDVDFRRVVRAAKDRVFPAVVFVKCIRENLEGGRKESNEVSGSGVLISADGELITNWHVVDKAIEIRCLLYDGRATEADLIGTDKDTDLALLRLKLPPGTSLPHAVLGDSTALVEGDFVMAMGAPWGLSRSVSIGIVSCTRRYLPENSEYSLWLQSDCAISPGNSGGPLVNTVGEVVGITARGYTVGGDLGFAIPAETVRIIIDSIREHGFVNWTWYGLQLQPLRDFNRNTYFEGDAGVIVSGTDPESPARHAGLLPRDRILSANGKPLTAMTEEDLPAVRSWLGLLPKDEPVKLEVQRGDERLEISVTPRAKGKVEGEEYDCKRWDMTVKAINQFDTPAQYFYRKEGVFIFGLKHPGNASSARLAENDILLAIDGHDVVTLADVQERHEAALADIATNHRVVLTVMRNGLQRQVVLDFARDYERE